MDGAVATGGSVGEHGRPGRCLDNVFVGCMALCIENARTFICGYEKAAELERGLRAYFRFYNSEQLHQSLKYKTPEVVYRRGR